MAHFFTISADDSKKKIVTVWEKYLSAPKISC